MEELIEKQIHLIARFQSMALDVQYSEPTEYVNITIAIRNAINDLERLKEMG